MYMYHTLITFFCISIQLFQSKFIERGLESIILGLDINNLPDLNLDDNEIIDEIYSNLNVNTKYKTQQLYKGIKIFGASLVIEEDNLLHIKKPIFGKWYDKTKIDLYVKNINPSITLDQALNIIINKLEGINTINEIHGRILSDLSIYFNPDDNAPYLVYLIKFTYKSDKIYHPMIIINANNGNIFKIYNEAYNIIEGCGTGGNMKIGKNEYCISKPSLSLNTLVYPLLGNDRIIVYDNKNQTDLLPETPVTCIKRKAENKCDVNDPQRNGAYCVGCDVFQYIENTFIIYQTWMNVTYPVKKEFLPLKVYIHVGVNYVNAYYDHINGAMVFGDGDADYYPLTVQDVTTHEIAHGFTDIGSDLIYYGESGGMNEAYSDIAAECAEYHFEGSNDWIIGGDCKKANGTGLRYMNNPPRDNSSIDNYTDFHEGMNVHYSSGLYNKASYLLNTVYNWSMEDIFKVFSTANLYYWTLDSTFNEGVCGLYEALYDLYNISDPITINMANGIQNAFNAVGLECIIQNDTITDPDFGYLCGNNFHCFYVDIYPSPITQTVKNVTIKANDDNDTTIFRVEFTVKDYACINPSISFIYELIDYDNNTEYMQILDTDTNLIGHCSGGRQCGTWHNCMDNYNLGVSHVNPGYVYSIYFIESANVDASCLGNITTNAILTFKCESGTLSPTIEPSIYPSLQPTTEPTLPTPAPTLVEANVTCRWWQDGGYYFAADICNEYISGSNIWSHKFDCIDEQWYLYSASNCNGTGSPVTNVSYNCNLPICVNNYAETYILLSTNDRITYPFITDMCLPNEQIGLYYEINLYNDTSNINGFKAESIIYDNELCTINGNCTAFQDMFPSNLNESLIKYYGGIADTAVCPPTLEPTMNPTADTDSPTTAPVFAPPNISCRWWETGGTYYAADICNTYAANAFIYSHQFDCNTKKWHLYTNSNCNGTGLNLTVDTTFDCNLPICVNNYAQIHSYSNCTTNEYLSMPYITDTCLPNTNNKMYYKVNFYNDTTRIEGINGEFVDYFDDNCIISDNCTYLDIQCDGTNLIEFYYFDTPNAESDCTITFSPTADTNAPTAAPTLWLPNVTCRWYESSGTYFAADLCSPYIFGSNQYSHKFDCNTKQWSVYVDSDCSGTAIPVNNITNYDCNLPICTTDYADIYYYLNCSNNEYISYPFITDICLPIAVGLYYEMNIYNDTSRIEGINGEIVRYTDQDCSTNGTCERIDDMFPTCNITESLVKYYNGITEDINVAVCPPTSSPTIIPTSVTIAPTAAPTFVSPTCRWYESSGTYFAADICSSYIGSDHYSHQFDCNTKQWNIYLDSNCSGTGFMINNVTNYDCSLPICTTNYADVYYYFNCSNNEYVSYPFITGICLPISIGLYYEMNIYNDTSRIEGINGELVVYSDQNCSMNGNCSRIDDTFPSCRTNESLIKYYNDITDTAVCPPTLKPSFSPTMSPLTGNETRSPTPGPTEAPSFSPSTTPSEAPSLSPSNIPSQPPSLYPSMLPSVTPTIPPSTISTELTTEYPVIITTDSGDIYSTIKTTESNDNESKVNSQLSSGILSLIIISIIIFFCLIGLLVFYLYKKKQKQNQSFNQGDIASSLEMHSKPINTNNLANTLVAVTSGSIDDGDLGTKLDDNNNITKGNNDNVGIDGLEGDDDADTKLVDDNI